MSVGGPTGVRRPIIDGHAASESGRLKHRTTESRCYGKPRLDAESLFRKHHAALFRYLIRLTGDPDQAADAAQETFRRLLERPPRSVQVRAWLFRVATNLVREEARTRTRRRRLLDRSPESAPTGTRLPGPSAAFEAKRRREAVHRALDELSWKERTILLMYAEGFKHREVAAAIGTTTRSVGTMIARALRKFGAALEADREVAG